MIFWWSQVILGANVLILPQINWAYFLLLFFIKTNIYAYIYSTDLNRDRHKLTITDRNSSKTMVDKDSMSLMHAEV